MTNRSKLSIIVFILCLPVFGYSQDQLEGEISGTIKSSNGVLPWQMVLDLVPLEGATLPRMTEVKIDGSFRFTKVGKGNYHIRISKGAGYIWSESTSELLKTRKWVAGNQANLDIVKGGVITGKVMQSGGQPGFGMKVQAISLDTSVNSSFSSFTDDRGIYRIYGLPPGKYLVTASPKESGKASVYYPSTTRTRATEIEINANEERGDINIQFFDLNGWLVSGKVIPAFGGSKPIRLRLIYQSDESEAYTAFSNMQGHFIFTGIPNQDYLLIAEQEGGQGKLEAVSKPQKVSVSGVDINNLALSLIPLTAITGKVIADIIPPTCQELIKLETVALIAINNTHTFPKELAKAFTKPDKAGSFLLSPLLSGEYTLRVDATNFGYIKSITRQNVPVQFQRIPSLPISSPLTVLVSYGGKVKFKSRAGRQARLFSEKGQLLSTVEKDANDLFNFSPVAPGKHSVMLSTVEIDDVEAIKQYHTKQKPLIDVLIHACKVETVTQVK